MFGSKKVFLSLVFLFTHGVALAHGVSFEHHHLLNSVSEILLCLLIFSGVVGAIFMPDTRSRISK